MIIVSEINEILNKKIKINNEKGEAVFWSQPDFSYKKRVHIYDRNDNEIGYVQYLITSSQKGNEVYDSFDHFIEFNNFKLVKNVNDYHIYFDEKEIAVCSISDCKIKIELNNEQLLNKIILFLYSKIL